MNTKKVRRKTHLTNSTSEETRLTFKVVAEDFPGGGHQRLLGDGGSTDAGSLQKGTPTPTGRPPT